MLLPANDTPSPRSEESEHIADAARHRTKNTSDRIAASAAPASMPPQRFDPSLQPGGDDDVSHRLLHLSPRYPGVFLGDTLRDASRARRLPICYVWTMHNLILPKFD
jgi:hypothetical protein